MMRRSLRFALERHEVVLSLLFVVVVIKYSTYISTLLFDLHFHVPFNKLCVKSFKINIFLVFCRFTDLT